MVEKKSTLISLNIYGRIEGHRKNFKVKIGREVVTSVLPRYRIIFALPCHKS
jgi:hypothetical protein